MTIQITNRPHYPLRSSIRDSECLSTHHFGIVIVIYTVAHIIGVPIRRIVHRGPHESTNERATAPKRANAHMGLGNIVLVLKRDIEVRGVVLKPAVCLAGRDVDLHVSNGGDERDLDEAGDNPQDEHAAGRHVAKIYIRAIHL
ncbi:hypothetical protein F4604DRAFT_1691472 [Suillus subluteus]|nr:hypothetical protein F4604DRAFT_1691472 [Suillus subluteus]